MCLDHHDPVPSFVLPWEPVGPEVAVAVDAPGPDAGHLLHQEPHPGVAGARERGQRRPRVAGAGGEVGEGPAPGHPAPGVAAHHGSESPVPLTSRLPCCRCW